MRKTDAERRAFLKSLKPQLVAIAEAAALRSGPVDEADLYARVAAGTAVPQEELAAEHAADGTLAMAAGLEPLLCGDAYVFLSGAVTFRHGPFHGVSTDEFRSLHAAKVDGGQPGGVVWSPNIFGEVRRVIRTKTRA